MSLIAAASIVLAAAAPARLEGVRLAQLDARPALILECVGNPSRVSVFRDGPWARVSLEGTTFGKGFSGAERFAWVRASLSAEAAAGLPLQALQIRGGDSHIDLLLQLPGDVSIDVRPAWQRVALVLRRASELPGGVTVARSLVHPAPAPTAPSPAAPPPPSEPAPAMAEAEPAPTVDEPTPAIAEPETELTRRAEAPAPAPLLEVPAVEPMPAVEPVPAPEAWVEGVAPLPAAEPAPASTAEATTGERVVEATAPEPAIAEAEATPAESASEAAALYAQLFPGASAPPAETEAGAAAAPSERGEGNTASLYATLFPSTLQSPEEQDTKPGAEQEPWGPSPELVEAYQQIFPSAPPPAQRALTTVETPVSDRGLALGFLRFEPGLSASYINADSNVLETPQPVNDDYFQVQPRLGLSANVWDGRMRVSYDPALRFGAGADILNSTTHNLDGRLELMLGPRVELKLSDRFVSGVLETAIVDPGYEYFFDLARFDRNDLDADARIEVSPRFFLELGGGLGRVRFDEIQPGGFFSYDTRRARAGLGLELTPTLRSVVDYSYDEVPTPDTRPEAESRAHSVNLTLSGDVLPLVTGEIRLGYRNQTSPNAAAGGRSYSGLTASGSLTKLFSPEASFTVWLGRSTPLSRFEENAFYVSNNLQGFLALPLPASLALNASVGHVWNDYRTPAAEIGVPREDRILSWYLGLKRRFGSNLWLSAGYNRQERRSNLDAFDVDSDGFLLQLDVRFSSLSGGGRR